MTRSDRSATGGRHAPRGRLLVWIGCLLPVWLPGPVAFASTADMPPEGAAVTARFDRPEQMTRLRGIIAADTCVTISLAGEWTPLPAVGDELTLATSTGAEVEIRVRPAAELRGFPQARLAERDAAALQRSYEDVLGKPALAVAHEPTSHAGVSRWSATWVDGNLANASQALTVETFIVETAAGSALELSFANFKTAEAHDAQVGHALSSLRTVTGRECKGRILAGW
jgi:hypothetical protein